MESDVYTARAMCGHLLKAMALILCLGMVLMGSPAPAAMASCPQPENDGPCWAVANKQPVKFELAQADQGLRSRAQQVGAWRLVRTPSPKGGADAISIMRTADTSRSDLDLAGLMLRCGEGSNVEILVVLIPPFPPRAQPQVTFGAAPNERRFSGTIAPPGSAVLLPSAANALMTGAWQTAAETTVSVESDRGIIHGTVPLDGFGSALQTLTANCGAR